MSTWGLGMSSSIDPETITDVRCGWQFCTMRVPQRFRSAGMYLCRDHGLLAWSIINEQLAEGLPTEETATEQSKVHELTEAEKKYGCLPIGHDGPFALQFSGVEDISPGVIYYIRTGGRIKIGHSINVERRLSQYPPDVEVLFLQTGGKDMERQEHRRFSAYLADGREWFRDTPEVTNLIEAMARTCHGWERLIDNDEWWRRKKRTAPEVTVSRIA